MNFRTEVLLNKAGLDISYSDRLFFVGSCFSNNIGQRLADLKFKTMVNPTGVLYNPCSIAQLVERVAEEKLFSDCDFFCEKGIWNSFHLHSSFSALSLDDIKNNANQSIVAAHDFLCHASVVVITLGTSWVYKKHDGSIVSNCHKLPSCNFQRSRLSVEEIVTCLENMIRDLHGINKLLNVVFTVSPIRHWKDGAHGNQLSKSTLLMAIDALQNNHPDSVSYFPSYEIMMDDLRDYRFYADDMLHPSSQAVDYIFQKFSDSYFSAETVSCSKLVQNIISDVNHRPINPESEEYKKFLGAVIKKIDLAGNMYPNLDLSAEREMITHKLGLLD